MRLLLLPGMDGTGRLFRAFEEALPSELGARVVAYPSDEPCSYEELFDIVALGDEPTVIVAESFSGPIGIRLAAEHPDQVRALVLVASFATSPLRLGALMSPFVKAPLFALPLPDFALRFALVGRDSPSGLLEETRAVIDVVAPSVMAKRLREIATVDVRSTFKSLTQPLLYIAGSRDRLVSKRKMAELRRLQPNMETVVIDAPHLVLQRAPHKAAQAIAEFVRRTARAG